MIEENKWYWECNGQSFTNKLKALQEGKRSNQPVRFIENPAYRSHDCSSPSDKTWTELIKQHALELREKYDHIRLWFSGGCDSLFILDSFVANNIRLDEIVIFHTGYAKSDFETIQAEEYIKKIRHLIPSTKINVNSHDESYYKNLYANQRWVEYGDLGGTFTFRSPHDVPNDNSFADLVGSKCEIIGKDKPHILKKNNKWYFYFIDHDVSKDMPLKDFLGTDIVNFYIDIPEIHIKQSHMLKDYIIANKVDLHKFYNNTLYRQDIQNKACGRLIYNINYIKKILIYETVEIGEYEFPIGSLKDLAFADVIKYSDVVRKSFANFKQDCFEMEKMFDAHYDFGKNCFIGNLSRFYCLDDQTVLTVDELFPDRFGLTKDKVDTTV